MRDKQIVLSKRLQMLADMVTPGNRLVDVGCDHGFLSICLVQQGVCPRALAMDVRTGPLAAAKEHIAQNALQEQITTRLSDGLCAYQDGEADTVVIAGMGGRLMAKILSDSIDKAVKFSELILQPQSELAEFRRFLRAEGFCIVAENAVLEDGKYYFAMKAEYAPWKTSAKTPATEDGRRQDLTDEYGELLLEQKHPVLQQYLTFRREVLRRLLEQLTKEQTGRTRQRLVEVEGELALVEWALSRFE